MLSLVTTCKNRLSHLQQTLPPMIRQSFCEVIVVDYGCEQGTADWVAHNVPEARLVRVTDDPVFSASRARNIGARQATGEFLGFIDADVLLNVDLGRWAHDNAEEGKIYLASRQLGELTGFVICSRARFEKIGGYDEAFRGWGHEDGDLYERLMDLGLKAEFLPPDAVTAIPHGNEMRQVGRNNPNGQATKKQALRLGEVYRLAKMDIQRLLNQEMALEFRSRLFQMISSANIRAVSQGLTEFKVTIDLPPEPRRNKFSQGQRKLVYTVPTILP